MMNEQAFLTELRRVLPSHDWAMYGDGIHVSADGSTTLYAMGDMHKGRVRASTIYVSRYESVRMKWYEIKSAGKGTPPSWAGEIVGKTLRHALRKLSARYEFEAIYQQSLADALKPAEAAK